MATSDNELQRAAQDIGTSIVEILKNKLNQEVRAGNLPVSQEQLPHLLGFLEVQGKNAARGALRSFYAKFDEYKSSLQSPKN